MASMCKLCVFLLNIYVISATTSTTPRFISYNSSDLSYLSNGIQFPAPETLETVAKLEDKLPTMQWLRELYSHHHWSTQLGKVTDIKCKYQMESYLRALKNDSSWAIKMYDASGRYTTNFFYGNDFWLGSHSLCVELANPETNRAIPPFPVHFYAVKIRININGDYTPVTRQIIIGQCLPSACSSADLKSILLLEKSQAESLVVVDVRPVPGSYRLMDDKKFHIVGGVTIAIFILILIATVVEFYLKRTHKQQHTKVQPTDLEISRNNNNAANADDLKKKQLAPHKQSNAKPLSFLLSFAAYTNGQKILAVDRLPKDSIRCIHGLRFFSITWIILVHTYLEVFSIADNKTMRTITERSFAYQTISNATFSVDTFFFISGLLVTITYFRSAAKSKAKEPREKTQQPIEIAQVSVSKFLMMITYRWLRLTPAYLFVIGVNELIARYTQSNSVFSPAMIDHITCDLFWWRNALYINNFYPQHEFCMLWSWYIANDTQFYVLATLFLIIAVRNTKCLKAAGIAMFTFLFTSWVTTFIISMRFGYVARVEEPFALFDQLYDKPWLRIGPYLIGMVTGWYMFHRQEKIKLPGWAILIGWTLSLSCLASVVYGIGRTGLVVPTSAFYATFSHTAWGLSLSWIVIACCHGFGGPVDTLLSFRGFLPLSRLAYCAYLIHPVIMVYTSLLMDGNIHLFQMNVLVLFMGNSVVSFMVAFLISMFFEAPVVRLLKIMFGSGSKDD